MVYAGTGNDRIEMPYEGWHEQEIGNGSMVLFVGDGDDTALGGWLDDNMRGEAGDDSLAGGYGNDRLDGGDGNDRLFGDDGNDRLTCGAGNDLLRSGNGSSILTSGDGEDIFSYHMFNSGGASDYPEHYFDQVEYFISDFAEGDRLAIIWKKRQEADTTYVNYLFKFSNIDTNGDGMINKENMPSLKLPATSTDHRLKA
ncbi:calcium-binding protein [Geminicoccus flavidas]|uniref:calcium-binding protein n=1 Tax=Geminicoccus flavidas TaxID=2506407 RepID=UPI00135705DD|nr:calcium-binding protein [Geminicoccus flavidas]